ncbi:MAG TPA: hypothetical protein PLB25_08425 [Rhodoferax sp.]|nr:hypothetical protein [Rhodoferax sp.]
MKHSIAPEASRLSAQGSGLDRLSAFAGRLTTKMAAQGTLGMAGIGQYQPELARARWMPRLTVVIPGFIAAAACAVALT